MLLIVDPALRSYEGHSFNYNRTIMQEAARLGASCSTLCSRHISAEIAASEPVIPCFTRGLEDDAPDLAESFHQDLVETVHSLDAQEDVILFLHTTTPTQIEPTVRFIRDHPNTRLIVLLRYSITVNPRAPDLDLVRRYRDALACIAAYGVERRVRLLTDSDLLRDEYELIVGMPIDVVPIPHVGDIPDGPMKRPRTLTYLGNARSSKGFQYLRYLVSQIRPILESGEWACELQANVMFQRDTESIVAVMGLRHEPVTLLETELNVAEYEALLARSSLVVIPYQTLWYHSQTSGVFAEAIGAGKPVIVSRGTWMARQLGDSGAGVLFAPGDQMDLVRATREAMANIDPLTIAAQRMQIGWNRTHNPESFVRAILEH
ncbi:MAG: glycosyltransferase [Acetobacteraceae bacterium]